MSLQQAWLARARPQILAAKAAAVLNLEVAKGCQREISVRPLALEPAYCPLTSGIPIDDAEQSSQAYEDWVGPNQLRRFQVWVSPEQSCDWERSERLLKQLCGTQHRVILELVGNQDGVKLLLGCHEYDAPVLRASFLGQFERCRLLPMPGNPLAAIPLDRWDSLVFRDYYPTPPYSHLLTRPELRNCNFRPTAPS